MSERRRAASLIAFYVPLALLALLVKLQERLRPRGKRKRASQEDAGVVKLEKKKRPAPTDSKSSPDPAASVPSLLHTYGAKLHIVLMHDVLDEPFAPTRPVMVRARSRARSRGVDAAKAPVFAFERGKILCFCDSFYFFVVT